ncbi:MAG: hypothetical protein J6X22_00425 [Muribaculaceae bacterium]|nr:hypothetical protein [Muribaculaceae bacterium]
MRIKRHVPLDVATLSEAELRHGKGSGLSRPLSALAVATVPPCPGCVWLRRGFHQRAPSAVGTFGTPATMSKTYRPSGTDCRRHRQMYYSSLPCNGQE